ncbi:MAG: HAMP domain-containing protein, partial [Candidatus Omnitrophica bacterium]|nr:HAMP domain-containing protein [Candidatus Omnitrophota bacterium]
MFKKNTLSLSLTSQGLKYKFKIAFYLMSVLPLLVSAYLVYMYLPHFGLKPEVILLTIISTVMALTGFFLLKQIFIRILAITTTAKMIAAGDIDRSLTVSESDEIGDLGDALNNLSRRIRDNMDELRNYSEKTHRINMEIQKRVLVISSLMQVSSLITQGTKTDDVVKLVVEKARLLADSDVAYFLQRDKDKNSFTVTVTDGVSSKYLLNVNVDTSDVAFSKVILNNVPLILDSSADIHEKLRQSLYTKFKLKNTLVLPIFLRGKVLA